MIINNMEYCIMSAHVTLKNIARSYKNKEKDMLGHCHYVN